MVNWDEVQKILIPIKNYEDVCQRLRISFSFAFVRQAYNFSLPELSSYTEQLLIGDLRGRYQAYASQLLGIIQELHHAGLADVWDLKERTASRELMELFSNQVRVTAPEIAILLKYLIYWVIPAEKYLSGLVRDMPAINPSIQVLGDAGLRTNLQLLQSAITSSNRKALANKTQLSPEILADLVNRADFSRLPWASKATISNIIGAGYGSLEKLANAQPDQLFADFFRYGISIGKNLKLGNEIENSYRIAKILPKIILEE